MRSEHKTFESKSRGRPKKSLYEEQKAIYLNNDDIKRGRGRPRKDREDTNYIDYINRDPNYEYIHCLPINCQITNKVYYYNPINNDIYNDNNIIIGSIDQNNIDSFKFTDNSIIF